jgi:hypothetical protein
MDGLVPEEQQDTYAKALAVLRANAPVVDNVACLASLDEQLGTPRGDIFDAFDEAPLASASIGQVYTATYQGRAVCVKVQYPGIKDATASDLKNIDALLVVAHRILPTMDFQSVIDNFELRLVEELDYEREAAWQRRFADIYRGHGALLVPDVVDELCREQVLVTERIDGVTFEPFLTDATEQERDRAGLALFTFAFGSLLRHGLFHADPHPGNLLFRSDGDRLGVLDYGCVQPFDNGPVHAIADLVEAACLDRPLHDPVRAAFELETDDETLKVMAHLAGLVLAPVSAPQPYTFTRSFASRISREVVDAKMALSTRMLTRRARFASTADGLMYVVRNLFGLANLWGQLGASGDFRDAALQMVADVRAGATAHA